jgi:hypothetical protein
MFDAPGALRHPVAVGCNACNFIVLSSVELDRESTFDAVEVDDV